MQQIITFRYQSLCVYFLHNYCEKNVTITVMYKIIIIFCNSVVFLSWVLNIERSVSFSLFKSNCVYLNVSMFSQLIISCDSVSSPLFLPPHLHDLPPSFPSLYLLSPCEYFTLLLPLVRDARDWALIVCAQCGRCGMRLLGVWCVVIGVWLLTPASRLPVCLSFCSVTPDRLWH